MPLFFLHCRNGTYTIIGPSAIQMVDELNVDKEIDLLITDSQTDDHMVQKYSKQGIEVIRAN